MGRDHLRKLIVSAMLITVGTVGAAPIVTTGRNQSGTATDWTFSSGIPGPSASDYADQNAGNGAVFSLAQGGYEFAPAFGYDAITAMNNGSAQPSSFDQSGQIILVTNGSRLLLDLNTPAGAWVNVSQIGSFSLHANSRTAQEYQVWGSNAATVPVTSGSLTAAGWNTVGPYVDTSEIDTALPSAYSDRHHGVRITDSTGSLGNYRYLLFEIFTPTPHGYSPTEYSEFDVFGTLVLPEPASLGVLTFGMGALLLRRRQYLEGSILTSH
jgi:hypothetical protein